MKYLFTIMCIGLLGSSFAQSIDRQLISSMGSLTETSSVKISQTTGEVVVADFLTGSIWLTQGFQQAKLEDPNAIRDVQIQLDYKIWPVPVKDVVHVTLTGEDLLNGVLIVTDVLGQELDRKLIDNQTEVTIDFNMGSFPSGNYFLVYLGEENSKKLATILKIE